MNESSRAFLRALLTFTHARTAYEYRSASSEKTIE